MIDKEKLRKALERFLNPKKSKESLPDTLEDAIPQILDVESLVFYWNSAHDKPRLSELIERQLEEVVKRISDVGLLLKYLEPPIGTRIAKIFENQAVIALRSGLALILDMSVLILYHEKTSFSLEAKGSIENQMKKVIIFADADDIPDWFLAVAERRMKIPDAVKDTFKEKAEEVYAKL